MKIHTKKCLAVGLLLTLAGCSSPGIYKTPIEDRSTVAVPDENPSVVTAADPSIGVTVTPVSPIQVVRSQRDESIEVAPSVPVAPSSVEVQQNPAIIALLDSAKQQTNGGNLRAAQTSLQRAQRIAPRDPEVYYSLADTHRRLGEFLQAEQVALKGVAIAQGQNTQLRRLWTLIASIRNDSGDVEGADKAAGIAERY
ncbi:MAG: tetratricopeptide repeat protein [Neptunomonas phycophila]|uniref:tetratricopeptide repeat protein n=1 Tax=Neptunomonas phycophila TaxID=1572645 RepID=UPI003B8C0676